MSRLIGAVVLGYAAMVCVVFAGLTVAYLAYGADRAFQPGVYDVSALWTVTSLVVGFGAALLGGWVSQVIARRANGPRALAVVVVVLGAALAVPALSTADAAIMRTGAVGVFDAMQQARTPVWIMLLNPVIGAIGVLIGGGALAGRGRVAAPDVRTG